MRTYLPPGYRCSAYFYAARAGMVSVPQAPGDLEFLRELGLRAASLARWEGIPAVRVPEGPYQVYLWPERIWSEVADAMANQAAEHGDYGAPEDVLPPGARSPGPVPPWAGFSREEARILSGSYGPDEPIPPWCPLPQGDQALRDTGY